MGSIGRVAWLLSLLAGSVWARNDTQPISIFRSRPDLVSPILITFTRVAEKQAPGYYFIAPYQQIQESVHIFDNDANLVWSGFGAIGPGICHAPQVCQYHGEPHLCFYQGTQMVGWGHGHGVIMDKHYRVVKSVEPSGSYQASSDMHEFMVIDDGKSALMTQYLRSAFDLCPWGLCDGLGYIQQGVFQEVDVETGKEIFSWKSLDHIDPSESYVGPGTTEISGTGEQPASPWDYFHINSIDKNQDGDYLISARHTSAVYKISGKDGHVIWRLHGAKSDFYLDNFSFSSQHDARFITDTEEETVLSVFDNGTNGFNSTQPHSTGQFIKINHKTKVATLIQNIDPPLTNGNGHVSKSQGNLQRLPNGNLVMGWGNDAFWTEYTSEGEVVFYGAIGWENVMNYRAHKFDNWVGLPLTKPALWTYSKYGSEGDNMYFYVSWNGATEVKHWRLYSSSSADGPWTDGVVVPKGGFETIWRHSGVSKYSYAEALDKDMQVLGTSEVQEIFVPGASLREYCDDLACRFMPTGEEREAAQREKAEEQRKKEEAERQAIEAQRVAKARAARNAKLYGAGLGGFSVLILLIIVLSTRNFVSRPVNSLIAKGRDMVARQRKGQWSGSYKAVPLEEQDGGRAPMITDGS